MPRVWLSIYFCAISASYPLTTRLPRLSVFSLSALLWNLVGEPPLWAGFFMSCWYGSPWIVPLFVVGLFGNGWIEWLNDHHGLNFPTSTIAASKWLVEELNGYQWHTKHPAIPRQINTLKPLLLLLPSALEFEGFSEWVCLKSEYIYLPVPSF